MSVDAVRAGGSFYVGDVLARAWNVFTGNLPFFLGITLLVYVAIGIVVGLLVLPFVLVAAGGSVWWPLFIAVPVGLLVFFGLNMLGEAVLLLGAFQRMRGQPLRVNEALQRAFPRFLPLIGLGILWALGLMVGTLLLIVPGVILLCMWWVVVPACVVENLGPIQSLSRSADLTRGYRWKIFGLFLLLTVINAIGGKMVDLVFGLAGDIVAGIGSLVWFVAWTALSNCVLIMTYHDLRVAKEGIDTEQIAAIFD
jgi:hypothetical protein